jgi:hypothetical protein
MLKDIDGKMITSINSIEEKSANRSSKKSVEFRKSYFASQEKDKV